MSTWHTYCDLIGLADAAKAAGCTLRLHLVDDAMPGFAIKNPNAGYIEFQNS